MRGPLHEQIPVLAGQSLRILVWDRDLVDMWHLDQDGKRQPYRGAGSTWHRHPELELTLITRGEGLLHVGDHVGRFAAPDCLLLGPRLPHVWKAEDATAGISVQFRLDPATGIGGLAESTSLARLWSLSRYGLRFAGSTAKRLEELLGGLERKSALARLSRFLAILEELSGAGGNARQLSTEPLLDAEPDARSEAMGRVLDHLLEHSDEEISLGDAVRLSGRSQATFCRHFVRLTGRTFAQYLTAVRIQEARRALAQTGRSVTEIAFGAGFTSLTSFHAAFRRQAGCTPLAYRRRLQAPVARRRG